MATNGSTTSLNGPSTKWRYIECERCGQKFHPQRETARERFNSKRCPLCGEKHSIMDVEVLDLSAETDDRKLYLMYESKHEEVKIGISNNPKERLDQLQVGRPNLELVSEWEPDNAGKVERQLHNELFEQSEGGEWFDISDNDVYSIKNIIDLFVEGN